MHKIQGKTPLTLTIMAILIGCLITWSNLKMLYLKHYGTPALGQVTSVKKVGSKGKYSCHYKYYVNDKTYKNNVKFNELSEGDLITVVYSHWFMNISVPEKFLVEFWNYEASSIGKEKLNAIKKIDLEPLHDKPIGLLLNQKVFENYTYKKFITESVGCLSHLYLGYTFADTTFGISIHPQELQYVKRCDYPDEKWDLDVFKKKHLIRLNFGSGSVSKFAN